MAKTVHTHNRKLAQRADLFQRSLYDVGLLWEHHRISVAVEHLATSITENLMGLVYPALFNRLPTEQCAIVSCTANEYHQIGGRMVADILQMHGWNSHFLGANTPLSDLLSLTDEKKPELVVLSLSVYFGMQELIRTVEAVTTTFPSVSVIVGGQAFRWGGDERFTKADDVAYVPDLSALESIVTSGMP